MKRRRDSARWTVVAWAVGIWLGGFASGFAWGEARVEWRVRHMLWPSIRALRVAVDNLERRLR